MEKFIFSVFSTSQEPTTWAHHLGFWRLVDLFLIQISCKLVIPTSIHFPLPQINVTYTQLSTTFTLSAVRWVDTDIEYSIPSLPKSDPKISNTYDSGAMTSEERISKNAKAAKTIAIVKSTILFFWMPLILLSWTSMIDLRQKVFGGFGGCFVLPSTNSAMNPTLFLFFNKEFHESFIKLLFFQLVCKSSCETGFASCFDICQTIDWCLSLNLIGHVIVLMNMMRSELFTSGCV